MKENSNMNGLMSKMIYFIINYPSLANDVVEERARHLPDSKVLMELIHSAQIDSDITKENLIQPFESKTKIYQRLQELSVMEPFLSENEAKDEFLALLTAAEKHQQRISTKAEEKKILDDIRRRKVSSGDNNESQDLMEEEFEDAIPFEESSDDKKDTDSLLAEIEDLKSTINRKTDLEKDYIKFKEKTSKVKTQGKELFIVLAFIFGPGLLFLLFLDAD